MAQTILRAAGEGEAIGTSPSEMMCTWLAAYIEDQGRRTTGGPDLADKPHVAYALLRTQGNEPFWTADNRLIVHVEAFVAWLTSDRFRTRAENKDVRRWLRGLDFKNKRLGARYSWKNLVERFEIDKYTSHVSMSGGRAQGDEGKITRRVLISPPGFDPS